MVRTCCSACLRATPMVWQTQLANLVFGKTWEFFSPMVWQKGWQILGSWQIRAQLAEICARLSAWHRASPASAVSLPHPEFSRTLSPRIYSHARVCPDAFPVSRPLPSLRRRRKPPPPWGTSSCAGLHPRATPGHYTARESRPGRRFIVQVHRDPNPFLLP